MWEEIVAFLARWIDDRMGRLNILWKIIHNNPSEHLYRVWITETLVNTVLYFIFSYYEYLELDSKYKDLQNSKLGFKQIV